MRTCFEVGDEINGVWGPLSSDGEQAGACVGLHGTTRIAIDQEPGPMGYYHVAVVWKGDNISAVLPLHMMELIDCEPKS